MNVAIVGGGKVGAALTSFLCSDHDVNRVLVCDKDSHALEHIEEEVQSPKLRTHRVGIEREMAFNAIIGKCDFLISALPSSYNLHLTELAVSLGIHYLDLGGSNKVFQQQMDLNKQARTKHVWVIPNSGLAPGLVNVIALHGFEDFDHVDRISIRSGGLPQYPKPPFYFQNSFSPETLVNEYLEKALIINSGKTEYVDPLEGYERFRFQSHPDLGEFESFYTSGQITSLAQHLENRVNELDFKSIRYPGHRDIFKALFNLGFGSTQIIDIKSSISYRDLLVRQLKRNLPEDQEDMVLMKVDITGAKDGVQTRRSYELIEYFDNSSNMSALMKCASLPSITIAKLIHQGQVPGSGGVQPPELLPIRQEILELLSEKGISLDIQEQKLEKEITP